MMMRFAVELLFLSLLVTVNCQKKCGRKECGADQCCLLSVFGLCADYIKKNAICPVNLPNVISCGCAQGLKCELRRLVLPLPRCYAPETTTTTSTTPGPTDPPAAK